MRMMDMVSGGRWMFGEERLIAEGGGGPKAVKEAEGRKLSRTCKTPEF